MKSKSGRLAFEVYGDVFHILASRNETEIARDLLYLLQYEYPTKTYKCDEALILLGLARRVEDRGVKRMEYAGEDY